MVNKNPKILLITYYWPPAGGAGVQRWLKMSKYLAKSFDFTVFHPENADYPITDDSLRREIPKNFISLKNKIWEPYSLAKKISSKNKNYQKGNLDSKENQSAFSKISLWIRANVFIPDARMLWIKPSVKYLKHYLRENPTDFIISTGPPHSTHLIALELKKSFKNMKWLADFRDPWTQIDYFGQLPFTKSSIKKHQLLEATVLKNADIVTTVSPSWAKELNKLGAKNTQVIYNGFDEEDFNQNFSKPLKNNIPEIVYVGSLNEDRNPSFLWKALDLFLKKNPKKIFKLKFVGHISELTKQEILKLENLSNLTTFLNYLPHQEVLEHTQNATILLLLMNDTPNIKGIIPGKFFEYLATGNPILSIGKKNTDLDNLLNQTASGEMINFGDTEAVIDFLNQYFKGEKFSKPLKILENKYTRRTAAEKIKNLIHQHL